MGVGLDRWAQSSTRARGSSPFKGEHSISRGAGCGTGGIQRGHVQPVAEVDEDTSGFQSRHARRVEKPGQAPTSRATGGDVWRRPGRDQRQEVVLAAAPERYCMARCGERYHWMGWGHARPGDETFGGMRLDRGEHTTFKEYVYWACGSDPAGTASTRSPTLTGGNRLELGGNLTQGGLGSLHEPPNPGKTGWDFRR